MENFFEEEEEGTLKLQKFFEEIGIFYWFQKRGSEQVKTVLITCVLWFCSRSVPASAQGPSSAAGAAGPPPATNVSSNKRLQQTQAQVDEVRGSRPSARLPALCSSCSSEDTGSGRGDLSKEADSTRDILGINSPVPGAVLQIKCGHWCQFRNSSQSARLGGNVTVEAALVVCSCTPKG